MNCKMCGLRDAIGNDVLCIECAIEESEDAITIDAFIADGHAHHCACRLAFGDGECECRRQQNWITLKPITTSGKMLVNFDCAELHDYKKEEDLLTLHALWKLS